MATMYLHLKTSELHKWIWFIICKPNCYQTYCEATVEIAAPAMPSWKIYIKIGKKNTAARFPNPATESKLYKLG